MSQQIKIGEIISTPDGQGKYKIISKLGDGSSGIVYQVEYSSQQNQQQISQFAMRVQKNIESNEIEIMKILMNNPSNNLVNIQKYWQSNDQVFIIMDLATDGNLYNFMEQTKNTLTKELKQDMFIQLCLGVQQLHKLNIMHRDLKPENILLQDNPQTQKHTLKICDYGLCKKTSNSSTKNIGTIYYMAPELLKNAGSYTKAIDIWALGCIWYSLVNKNEYLFKGQSQHDIQQIILNANQQKLDIFIQNLPLNNWEKNLMKSMISIESNKRPTIDQILMEINQNMQKPLNNQNQYGSNIKVNQPNIVKIIPQPPQSPQNQQIQNIQPNQQNITSKIPQIQFINKNDQSNQPILPNIVQSDEIENLLKNLKKELQQEINLVKQQVISNSNFNQTFQSQVEKQQTDLDNFQLQNQVSIIDQMNHLKKIIEIQNNNQNSIFDKELALLKQQFTQIQNNKQIQNLQNAIADQTQKYQSILDKEIQEIKQQSEQIFKQEREIVKLQQSIQQLPTTIENKLSISIQNQDEKIQQINQQFQNLQQKNQSLDSSVKTIKNQQQTFDSSIQSLKKQQVERYLNSDKLIEDLQQQMKKQSDTIDSQTMISIQKHDEVKQQLKQQSEQVIKSDYQINKLQQEIKQLPKYMESKTINLLQNCDQQIQELKLQFGYLQKLEQSINKIQQDMQLLTNNIKESNTKSQKKINSTNEQLQQQVQFIQKSDSQVQKLQKDMQQLTNTIDLTKNEYQQHHEQNTKQYQQQEEIIRKLQQDLKELSTKIEYSTMNQMQTINEENKQLKQKVNQIQESEYQIRNTQQGIDSDVKIINNKIIDQKYDFEQNIQQLRKQVMKEFQNTFEDMKQKLDEEIQISKQQWEQMLKQDKNDLQIVQLQVEVRTLQTTTEDKVMKLTQQCDGNFFISNIYMKQLQEQMKDIESNLELAKTHSKKQFDLIDLQQKYQLKELQTEILKLQTTIQNKIIISLQKFDGDIEQQTQQFIKIDNRINAITLNTERDFYQSTQELKQQGEQMMKQDEQIKAIQDQINQLLITINSKFKNQISKLDGEILQLNQQVEEIQKSEEQLKLSSERNSQQKYWKLQEDNYQKIQLLDCSITQASSLDKTQEIIQSDMREKQNDKEKNYSNPIKICEEITHFNYQIQKVSANIKKISIHYHTSVQDMESIKDTLQTSSGQLEQIISDQIQLLKTKTNWSNNSDFLIIKLDESRKLTQQTFETNNSKLQMIIAEKIKDSFKGKRLSYENIKQFGAGIKTILENLEKNNANIKQYIENEVQQFKPQIQKQQTQLNNNQQTQDFQNANQNSTKELAQVHQPSNSYKSSTTKNQFKH